MLKTNSFSFAEMFCLELSQSNLLWPRDINEILYLPCRNWRWSRGKANE